MKTGFNLINEKGANILFTLVVMFAYPITFINSFGVQNVFSSILNPLYFSLNLFKF